MARIPLLQFFLISSISAVLLFKRQGEDCDMKEGNDKKGICRRREACDDEKTKSGPFLQSPVCGYIGVEQLICCQPTSLRAKTACKEYPTLKSGPRIIQGLINGGRPASPKEFPHMVALGIEGDNTISWACAGSLISSWFIVTAAHCFNDKKPSILRFGDINVLSDEDDQNAVNYYVSEVIIHPRYNRGFSKYYDIALIKTDREVKFGEYVFPACIQAEPEEEENEYGILGWGSGERNSLRNIENKTQILMYADVVSTDNDQCNKAYNKTFLDGYPMGIIRSQFCSEYTNTTDAGGDACEGDSGGPLQYKYHSQYYITGIVSGGLTCYNGIPGIYTNVATFAPWIETFVWP